MKLFARSLMMVFFLLIIITCLPFYSQAQIGANPCEYQDPMIPCPIDGGLSALLIIGVGYGIKKVRDARKEEVDH